MLDVTLNARPAVYTVWIVISLLTIPMFTMSAKELAPVEDQGVIFGIVDAAANSTLDQNSSFAAAVNKVFMSVPETDFTFQVTMPNSGFSGMQVKPWNERKRNVFQIMPEVQQKLQQIPGIQVFPVTPPALARRGTVSGGIHSGLHGRDSADSGICPEIADEGHRKAACSPSRR